MKHGLSLSAERLECAGLPALLDGQGRKKAGASSRTPNASRRASPIAFSSLVAPPNERATSTVSHEGMAAERKTAEAVQAQHGFQCTPLKWGVNEKPRGESTRAAGTSVKYV